MRNKVSETNVDDKMKVGIRVLIWMDLEESSLQILEFLLIGCGVPYVQMKKPQKSHEAATKTF